MLHTLAWGYPGPFEMIMIAALGLLIFGKRLPEVGRNIGKGIVEFKRGLKEAEHEINSEVSTAPPAALPPATQPPAPIATTPATPPTYKFDPYTGKPLDENVNA